MAPGRSLEAASPLPFPDIAIYLHILYLTVSSPPCESASVNTHQLWLATWNHSAPFVGSHRSGSSVRRLLTMATKSERTETCVALDNPDTNNATFFRADDIGKDEYWPADFLYLKKRDYFAYLKDFNEGCRNGPKRYNNRLVTQEAASDLIRAISGQLEMTPIQRNHARRYFTALDREKLGLSLVLDAYCLCMYVVEQDKRNEYRRCHPNLPEEKKDELFQQVACSLGLTERDIQKTYGKIQSLLWEAPIPRDTDQRDSGLSVGGGI